jgi:hypothetical protein
VVPAGSDGQAGTPANVAHMAATPLGRHEGMSKPLDPFGTVELTEEERLRALRRARRRMGKAPPPWVPRFVEGKELLDDGSVLHLATVRFADASLSLEGQDHPAFAALKAEFADVLRGPPPGLPPDRGIELVLETGNRGPGPSNGCQKASLRCFGANSATCCSLGGVRAEARRLVAHLLRLWGPQRHHGAPGRTSPAH